MLSALQHVRLDKLSAQQTPAGMLPNGYYLKGVLVEAPQVGCTLRVGRYERAAQTPAEITPVQCAGLYVSTPVQSITENADGSVDCKTLNSTWRITPLKEPSSKKVLDTAAQL